MFRKQSPKEITLTIVTSLLLVTCIILTVFLMVNQRHEDPVCVPRTTVLTGRMVIVDGADFSQELSNSSSLQFKALAFDVQNLVSSAYSHSELRFLFGFSQVLYFSQGSVVVHFDLGFNQLVSAQEAVQQLVQGLNVAENSGLVINPDSIELAEKNGQTTAAPTTTPPYDEMLTCNFERDLCNWKQMYDDDGRWLRVRGPTFPELTGPSVDHTLGNSLGYYIVTDTESDSYLNSYRIQSVPIRPTKEPMCLSFWYHMYGVDVHRLRVLLVRTFPYIATVVFQKDGNYGDNWNYGQVTLNVEVESTVMFDALKAGGIWNDIALDDIKLTFGPCGPAPPDPTNVPVTTTTQVTTTTMTTPPSPEEMLTCNFERDFCNWKQMYDDDGNWMRDRGSTYPAETGPSVDHTLGNSFGYYIVTSSAFDLYLNRYRIQSVPIRPTKEPMCLSFWYHMYGADVHSLKVLLVQTFPYNGTVLFQKDGNYGDNWNYGQVTLNVEAESTVIFEALNKGGRLSDIALDDIKLTFGPCGPAPPDPTNAPVTCDYLNKKCADGSKCLWMTKFCDTIKDCPDGSDEASCGTLCDGQYVLTGPSGSFSSSSNISYLDTYPTCRWIIRVDPGFYLQVNIQFKSEDLDVLVFSEGVGRDLMQIVRLGRPPLTPLMVWLSSDLTTVDFYGGRLTNQSGFDAFYTTGKISDLSDEEKLTCNFEHGMCLWRNMDPDRDWKHYFRWSFPEMIGPSVDHTFGNSSGSYMMSTYVSYGGSCRIQSPTLSPREEPMCLSFWYHTNGKDVPPFKVLLRQSSAETVLFQRQGNLGNNWLYGQATLHLTAESTVVFEVVKKGGFDQNEVAVDDIALTAGPCGPDPPEPTNVP